MNHAMNHATQYANNRIPGRCSPGAGLPCAAVGPLPSKQGRTDR